MARIARRYGLLHFVGHDTTAISDAETGTGTDAETQPAVTVFDNESGAVDDGGEFVDNGVHGGAVLLESAVPAIAASLTDDQPGTGTEAQSVIEAITDTETATGTDGGESIPGGFHLFKADTESGIGVDTDGGIQVVAAPPLRFTPPTENEVSPVDLDAQPLANKLMRYFPTRPRGKSVWQLPDGTYSFDEPFPLVTPADARNGNLFPVPPQPHADGVGQSDSNLNAITYVTVYYGGHIYLVDPATGGALSAFLVGEGYDPDDWLVPV